MFHAIALCYFISAGTLPEKDVCDPGGNRWSVSVKWMTLIFDAMLSKHDDRIREVPRRLQKENVTLNSNKCQFSVQEVKFLGQTIDESGMSPDQDKVKAIIDMSVEKCDKCPKKRQNRFEPMISSDMPECPWQTVCSDLIELNCSNYLLDVDIPVRICRNRQIEHFFSLDRERFEIHICTAWNSEFFLTDNSLQYLSQTFTASAEVHGFTHRTSIPIYQQSNGVYERAVKTIKGSLEKSEDQYESLVAYRSNPLNNGYSPAGLLLGRNLRTTFPVVPSSLDQKWSHFQDAGNHIVKIGSVKRKRLINATEWST